MSKWAAYHTVISWVLFFSFNESLLLSNVKAAQAVCDLLPEQGWTHLLDHLLQSIVLPTKLVALVTGFIYLCEVSKC